MEQVVARSGHVVFPFHKSSLFDNQLEIDYQRPKRHAPAP